jgi:predicted metalloenzyme YecM
MNEIETFLDNLYKEINETGIDLTNLKIDHLAYSTSSTKEYEETLPKYLSQGEMVKEAIISNRRVAVIILKTPINYKNNAINALEVIEPIEGQESISGWEHAEFLVDNYNALLNKYPKLPWDTNNKDRRPFSRIKLVLPSGKEVKFLNTPVLVSAKEES